MGSARASNCRANPQKLSPLACFPKSSNCLAALSFLNRFVRKSHLYLVGLHLVGELNFPHVRHFHGYKAQLRSFFWHARTESFDSGLLIPACIAFS